MRNLGFLEVGPRGLELGGGKAIANAGDKNSKSSWSSWKPSSAIACKSAEKIDMQVTIPEIYAADPWLGKSLGLKLGSPRADVECMPADAWEHWTPSFRVTAENEEVKVNDTQNPLHDTPLHDECLACEALESSHRWFGLSSRYAKKQQSVHKLMDKY